MCAVPQSERPSLGPIPNANDPRSELIRRAAWTLAMIAAYTGLGHVPLVGLSGDALHRMFAPELDQSGAASLALGEIASHNIRSLSIVPLGIGPYMAAIVVAMLARGAFPRLAMRLDARGGWDALEWWAKRLCIPITLILSWGALRRLNSPFDRDFIPDPGLFGYYLPNMAAMLAGTFLCIAIASTIRRRGIGDGVLTLGAVGLLSRILGDVLTIPELLRTGVSMPRTVLFEGLAVLLVVAAVGLGHIALRQFSIQHAKFSAGNQPWVRTLAVSMLPASIWPLNAGITASVYAPVIFMALSLVLGVRRFRETDLLAMILQLSVLTLLAPAAVRAAFNPDALADRLRTQGSFLPGIRPGRKTSEELRAVGARLLLSGIVLLWIVSGLDWVACALWRHMFPASSVFPHFALPAAAGWICWRQVRSIMNGGAFPPYQQSTVPVLAGPSPGELEAHSSPESELEEPSPEDFSPDRS